MPQSPAAKEGKEEEEEEEEEDSLLMKWAYHRQKWTWGVTSTRVVVLRLILQSEMIRDGRRLVTKWSVILLLS